MLQGGTFDRVHPRRHSAESLKANRADSRLRMCCGHTRYVRMYMYPLHTYRPVYVLFHNALNATGSTSEIVRSEECIRVTRVCGNPGERIGTRPIWKRFAGIWVGSRYLIGLFRALLTWCPSIIRETSFLIARTKVYRCCSIDVLVVRNFSVRTLGCLSSWSIGQMRIAAAIDLWTELQLR